MDLWRAYLTKFIKRYAGTKIERTRDLFQQLLETVTTEHALEFFNM
jgi:pre-mRNA-splicing factor SYF1